MPSPTLKVNEIFFSIQGESTWAGLPFVFIRLTGCNLRCTYCDTTHAFKKGEKISLSKIMELIRPYHCKRVCITGGEPLLQEAVTDLAEQLITEKFDVLVETNGTQDITRLPSGTFCVMDIKCPGSGEHDKTDWENLNRLGINDEIKFVIGNRTDYDWAINLCRSHKLLPDRQILFSPVQGLLKPADLAQWIIKDQVPIRLQLQLHHIIWPGKRGV